LKKIIQHFEDKLREYEDLEEKKEKDTERYHEKNKEI
jgi:hypothetical protein